MALKSKRKKKENADFREECPPWHTGIGECLGSEGMQVQFLVRCSGLRTRYCGNCGLDCTCGLNVIPGVGTPYAMGQPRKRKRKLKKKKENGGVPVLAQWKQIRLGTMRLQVQSLALLRGLRIRCCHKLWCRSQTWL